MPSLPTKPKTKLVVLPLVGLETPWPPPAPIVDDPEIQAALRARVEYERTSTSLFGRFTPEELSAYGISPISSPFGGTPFV